MRLNKKFKTILPITLLGLLSAFLPSCSHYYEDIIPDVLLIGDELEYQPYGWTTNAETEGYTMPIDNHYGSYAEGYDPRMGLLLGQLLGVEVRMIQTPWESIITDLQFGAIDLIMTGMTDTPERREVIDFTDDYYFSEMALVLKKDIADQYDHKLNEEELEALIKDKVVISGIYTIADDIIGDFADRYGAIHAVPLPNNSDCATDVSFGSSFAFLAEYTICATVANSYSDLSIVRFDQSIIGDQYNLGVSIGIRKGMTKLKTAINDALKLISQETREQIMLESIRRAEFAE